MSNIKFDSPIIDYDLVTKYYNKHKAESWNLLYKLDRLEGGFCIDIKNYEPNPQNRMSYDANAKIKQLRWKKGVLYTPSGFNCFNSDESALLLSSLQSIYGIEKAFLV